MRMWKGYKYTLARDTDIPYSLDPHRSLLFLEVCSTLTASLHHGWNLWKLKIRKTRPGPRGQRGPSEVQATSPPPSPCPQPKTDFFIFYSKSRGSSGTGEAKMRLSQNRWINKVRWQCGVHPKDPRWRQFPVKKKKKKAWHECVL